MNENQRDIVRLEGYTQMVEQKCSKRYCDDF